MFCLTKDQQAKVEQWLHTVIYPPIVERQLQDPKTAALVVETEDGKVYPYTGAIGGGLTYSFYPTSIGTIIKVSHKDVNGDLQVLDITDYDTW